MKFVICYLTLATAKINYVINEQSAFKKKIHLDVSSRAPEHSIRSQVFKIRKSKEQKPIMLLRQHEFMINFFCLLFYLNSRHVRCAEFIPVPAAFLCTEIECSCTEAQLGPARDVAARTGSRSAREPSGRRAEPERRAALSRSVLAHSATRCAVRGAGVTRCDVAAATRVLDVYCLCPGAHVLAHAHALPSRPVGIQNDSTPIKTITR